MYILDLLGLCNLFNYFRECTTANGEVLGSCAKGFGACCFSKFKMERSGLSIIVNHISFNTFWDLHEFNQKGTMHEQEQVILSTFQ